MKTVISTLFTLCKPLHKHQSVFPSFLAGRAIRHREDYAVIVLADQRYARPSVTSKLPAWISRQLTTLDKFPSALTAISKVSLVGGETATRPVWLHFQIYLRVQKSGVTEHIFPQEFLISVPSLATSCICQLHCWQRYQSLPVHFRLFSRTSGSNL